MPVSMAQWSIILTMSSGSPVGNISQPELKSRFVKKMALLIPPISQKILDNVSMNIEFIYNTPVVEKLRRISIKKWYQIFWYKSLNGIYEKQR